MRTNLLVLGLVLLVASLLARTRPPVPPRIEWEASFWLRQPNRYGSRWLDFENNSYKICGVGCTGGSVSERGRVERTGPRLELTSDQGKRTSYSLVENNGERVLQDGKSGYAEKDADVPRLHPDQSWLRADLPLELDRVSLGMTRAEVLQVLPDANADADGALVTRPYRNHPIERVTIEMGEGDRVQVIGGIRLSQGGRPLLNEWSTRREVECLFGRLSWKRGKPGSYGTSEEASCGGLKIRVHALLGMTSEEARVSKLILTR